MNSRERVRTIFDKKEADRCGFWLGNPHDDSWKAYFDYFGVTAEEELRSRLGDDVRWICPQWTASNDPKRLTLFLLRSETVTDVSPKDGPLADAESVGDVDAYSWPVVEDLDFSGAVEELRNTGDVYRASGFWTCFFHDVSSLFGMEHYFTKMYTHPEVVHAVTKRVCDFYLKANERFFRQAGDTIDGFFFGNDFGTQLDLLISPQAFDEFIMPWFRKFTDQGHSFGYQVLLHSCGAIYSVIDKLIDAGVDALHPLQALANRMDAETLARDFGGRVAFFGGVDTQELLVNGTAEDVRSEVERLKKVLGPFAVISPSHETLLPNVPPENVKAMAEAAAPCL